jgi:tRNA G46 methylase TrmB
MDIHAKAGQFSPFPDNDTEITRLMMRHLLLQEEIASFCPNLRERDGVDSVLDVACGPGWWVLAMAQEYRDVDFVGIATFLSRLYARRPVNNVNNEALSCPADNMNKKPFDQSE